MCCLNHPAFGVRVYIGTNGPRRLMYWSFACSLLHPHPPYSAVNGGGGAKTQQAVCWALFPAASDLVRPWVALVELEGRRGEGASLPTSSVVQRRLALLWQGWPCTRMRVLWQFQDLRGGACLWVPTAPRCPPPPQVLAASRRFEVEVS